MDTFVVTVLVALIAIASYLYRRTFDFFQSRGIHELKSPYPFIGLMTSSLFSRKNITEVHQEVYNMLKGRKFAGTFVFTTPGFVIGDPELIRSIAVKDFDHFTDRSKIGISSEDDPIFGRNLLALKGQEWRDMRATLSPAFTSSKMKAMFKLVTEISKQMVDFLEEKNKEQQKVSPKELYCMEMKDLFMRFANDIIASAAFGVACNSLNDPDNEFQKMGKGLAAFGPSRLIVLLGYLFFPKLMKKFNFSLVERTTKDFFHNLVHSSIAEREAQGIVRPDMIHLLMEARRGTLTAEQDDAELDSKGRRMKMTDEDMTAQAVLFFLGGFDTISTTLSFVAYHCAVHEEIQQKLQTEIADVVGDEELTYDMLHQLKYMDMVFAETLRRFPPAVITDRACVKRYVIPASETEPEVVLEPGYIVWFPVYGLHHDPKYFPDPQKFDPERFSEENKRNIRPFTYLPFGAGPRICIGQRFAVMEAKAAMVYILQRFNLKVVSKTQIPLTLAPKMNVVSENGIWLGFEPRYTT